MGQYYDITTYLFHRMPIWKGDPEVKFNKMVVMLNNMDTHATELSFSTHSGTHLDLPGHFFKEDSMLSENIPLSILIGSCVVIDRPFTVGRVASFLDLVNEEIEKRVIFKTDIIKDRELIVYKSTEEILTPELVDYLIRNNIKIVGFDSPSPEKTTNEKFPIHQQLFKHEIIIIENLYLQDIKPGKYELICLPLLIKGINDGVPCRTILKNSEFK
jgi:arylformamidase